MTRDEIIDAFLIPLAWETVNGDQKSAWPYCVRPGFDGTGWIAFHRDDPLLPLENGQRITHPNEADAIKACEADHRAEAVKTWDIAKIEALVGAVSAADSRLALGLYEMARNITRAALATIRGRK